MNLIITQGCGYWLTEKNGREREREGERNMDVKQKHWSVAYFMHPDQRLNPQPRYVPWPGIEPTTFWYMQQPSYQLKHLARAMTNVFT